MRIDEFKIIKYGPLHDYGKTKLKDFTLFFGENEDGKSLSIDALTKLLFGGKDIKEFDSNINRVDEKPDGYVGVRDSKGKLIKISEKGSFRKNYDLTATECRNIFIIRNSDLSITSEDKFYNSVGARLMGLKTGELTLVEEKLREIGKITPGNKFRNDMEKRIDDSKALLENIDLLTNEIEKEDLDKLETENIELNNELQNVEGNIKLLEDASKREIYEKGISALVKLKESLQNFNQLEQINEEDERKWLDAQRDIDAQTKIDAETQKDLETNKNTLMQKTDELNKAEQAFSELKITKQKLNEEIKPKISEYETKKVTVVQQTGKSKFFTVLSSFFALMLLIVVVGILISPTLSFYLMAVVFGLLLAVSLVTEIRYISNKATLAGVFEKIKLLASVYNLSGDRVEEILPKIESFDQEYEIKSTKLTNLKAEKQTLENKVNGIQNKTIPDIQLKLKDLGLQIETIISKSGTASLEKYSESLAQKLGIKKIVEQQNTILESTFETSLKEQEQRIGFWTKEIIELEDFKDKANDTKYSTKTDTALKKRQSDIDIRQKEIDGKLATAKEEMKTIERKASEILRSSECINCETNMDLKAIRNVLVDFIENNENGRNNVLDALNIFEEIENEEKSKVTTLFGDDSKVSEYFREITNNFYKSVRLDPKEQQIQVERNDGEIFNADQLSSGTYDQLYLSIRLALGDKLLKGEKGFFIMDDPFIKSDKKRLERQLKILTKISQSGWQILYFSAKDEVKEALQKSIETGSVNLVETRAVAR